MIREFIYSRVINFTCVIKLKGSGDVHFICILDTNLKHTKKLFTSYTQQHIKIIPFKRIFFLDFLRQREQVFKPRSFSGYFNLTSQPLHSDLFSNSSWSDLTNGFTIRADGVSRYAEEIGTSGNGIFALAVRASVCLDIFFVCVCMCLCLGCPGHECDPSVLVCSPIEIISGMSSRRNVI